MTVPGKGGRPRKWRSDADRVRAFRARARGEDEPPTIELALQYGDDAAAAWDQVRELSITVDALTAELKQTRATLRRAEKELEREQARSSSLSEANDRLRIELDTAERERAVLQAQLAELAQIYPAPNPRPAAGPNRAQRRLAERKRHRSP
jgi:septal ring factor EnvC (AmiA/AmiB activator)